MTARDGHWWATVVILLGCALIAAAWCLEVVR